MFCCFNEDVDTAPATTTRVTASVFSLQSSVFGFGFSCGLRRRHQGVACQQKCFLFLCFCDRGARQRLRLRLSLSLRRLHAMTIGLCFAVSLSRSLSLSCSFTLPLSLPSVGIAEAAAAFAAALRIGSNYCGKPLSYNLPD